MNVLNRRATVLRRSVGSTRFQARTYASAEATSSATATATAPSDGRPSTAARRAAASSNTDLVAPPDPLSNMRPVLYASTRRRRPSNSPYSSAEFPAEAAGTGAAARAHELELTFTMHRERVDMANHRFWATTNADFDAQRDARLAELPPASDPPSPEDEARREAALTQFYRDWQIGQRGRQQEWIHNWWRDVWQGIKLQGKVYIARWRAGQR